MIDDDDEQKSDDLILKLLNLQEGYHIALVTSKISAIVTWFLTLLYSNYFSSASHNCNHFHVWYESDLLLLNILYIWILWDLTE